MHETVECNKLLRGTSFYKAEIGFWLGGSEKTQGKATDDLHKGLQKVVKGWRRKWGKTIQISEDKIKW